MCTDLQIPHSFSFFFRAHVCEKHSRKDQDCLAEEETPENVKISNNKILPAVCHILFCWHMTLWYFISDMLPSRDGNVVTCLRKMLTNKQLPESEWVIRPSLTIQGKWRYSPLAPKGPCIPCRLAQQPEAADDRPARRYEAVTQKRTAEKQPGAALPRRKSSKERPRKFHENRYEKR